MNSALNYMSAAQTQRDVLRTSLREPRLPDIEVAKRTPRRFRLVVRLRPALV